jgi:hypothetical protein
VRPSAHTVQVGVEIDAGALPAARYTVAMVAGDDLVNLSSARVFTFTVDVSRKGGCNRTMHTSLLDRGYQNEAIDVFAGHGGISVDNLQAVGLIRFMGSDV